MEIFEGRPADAAGRLPQEIRVYDVLDELAIPYYRTDHAPATTMEVCHEIDGVLDTLVCKNLFLCNSQKTRFYLLLMPGDKPFKTKDLSVQINSARLSFGSPEKMQELLNLAPGSVSVFGLLFDAENAVQLLIDEDVLEKEYLGSHPCINTSTVKWRTKDLTEKFLPLVHHSPIMVKL